MKKATVLLLVFILFFCTLYAEEPFMNKKFYYPDDPGSVFITEETITFEDSYGKHDTVKNTYSSKIVKTPYFTKLITSEQNYTLNYIKIGTVEFLAFNFKARDGNFYNNLGAIVAHDDDKSIKVSPSLNAVMVNKAETYLREQNGKGEIISYLPDFFSINDIPWAVAADENNKSLYFTVQHSKSWNFEPVTQLVIVNGFVSVEKEHLYEQNSRAKTIRITYDDVSFVRELKDTPDFQIIDLEKPIAIDTKVKKDTEIKLTIEEWYPGTKYSDIVISALLYPKICKE